MRRFEKDPFCPVGIHTLPLQYLVTNHSESADNLAVNQKIGELYAYCGQYGNRSSYNVGFVQKRETLETGNFLDYRDFYLILIVCRRKCDTRFGRRESIFAIIIKDRGRELKRRTGSCSDMPRNRKFLLDDRFYEEYMVDALTSQEMEQYITRIAVKILR